MGTEPNISNPLSLCHLWLEEGKLGIRLPDLEEQGLALATLPTGDKQGDMGTAQLPCEEDYSDLTPAELAYFL